MKKLCKAAATFPLRAGVLAGCRNKENTKTEKKISVASVTQTVEHKSLNTTRDSFKAEMEALGYKGGKNTKLDFRDAGGQQNTLNPIMSIFTGNKSGVIMAIATSTAMMAVKYSKDIPIVFFAVGDPVGAGLMGDLKKPDNNITGTSDEIQVDQILDFTLKVDPNLKTPGFTYNSSEANSVSNLAKIKEFCRKHDIKLMEGSGANIMETQNAVSVPTNKCDAVFAPNDNTVANSTSALVEIANKKKAPVYTGTDSMASDSGFVTAGIDYTEFGRETVRMMDKILKGEDVGDLPVRVFKDNLNIYVNEKTMEILGIQLLENVENSKNLVMMQACAQ